MKLENWCDIPTNFGVFRMYDTNDESVNVISACSIEELITPVPVRIHSSCRASEVFHALDCDCADQLKESMRIISRLKNGLVIYLHQEGRGQGLSNKIKAVKLMQTKGIDTADAFYELGLELDPRTYIKATDILQELGVHRVALITNNPRKIAFVKSAGIEVSKIIPTHPIIREENKDYLHSKNKKLSHMIPV